MKWSNQQVLFLQENYPKKGRNWCADKMSLTTAQVRMKASRLQLKAMGSSDAWLEGQIKAASSKVGKKRPGHSQMMKERHKNGFGGFALLTSEQRKSNSKTMWKKIKNSQIKWQHPKGMLGKKHTDECRLVIGKKSKKAWKNMPQTKKQERTVKIAKSKEKNGTFAQPRPHTTWKGGWREIGGFSKYYRSRWEANYARYLEWLKNTKNIMFWEHEPKVFWFEGIKRGTVSYLPDFRIWENDGKEVYHEVKGWMDARSKTKIRRMKKYHPTVKLIIIGAKEYKSIASKVSSLIADWE